MAMYPWSGEVEVIANEGDAMDMGWILAAMR
jgi:hypothetical protein